MNIGDVFFLLRGDGGPLMVDAEKAAAAAAEAGGKTFNQKFGATLKAAAGGLVGAGLGAAFATAISGANELDAATRRLQADTGMTATEAKRAQGAIADLYRSNLQGFDEIGRAMSKVITDLGLTGEAADAATEKFLDYATATGQDAADAVTDFDDVLDAWGLTAADAGRVMDQLVASHQKYGGSIGDSQKALAALAPQLRALNVDTDGAIGLMNLFAASGLDASKATFALNTAVKNLKPGQSLDDLIAQIAAIEDPTLRAQAAIDVFGARGGVALANVLRPGITGLADFEIAAGDAAGATADAAAAIESSFGNQFQLLLKNAGGWLAEFGTNFGGLLMVASAFGPQLTRKIGAGLGGLAGLLIPKVTAAVAATGVPAALAGTKVGAMIGTAMGAALPVAMAVGLGAAIGGAIGMAIIGPEVDKAKETLKTKVGEAITNAVTEEDLRKMRATIQAGLDRMNAGEGTLFGWDIFGGKDALQEQLDAVDAEIAARAEQLPVTAAEGITEGAPAVQVAVEDVVSTFGLSMEGVTAAARATGAEGMAAMAGAITAARQKPLDAFNTLKEMLKNAMTPMGEIARIHGELTSKELAKGLKSGDPAVRAQAVAVAKAAADRLAALAEGGGKAGRAAMAELDKGMKSKLPEVRAASQAAKDAVMAKLNATKASASAAGSAAGQAFAKGLERHVSVNAYVGFTINVPGYAVGDWDIPRNQLAVVHQGEMIIPAAQSEAIRAGQAAVTAEGVVGTGGGGGGSVTVNVYNPAPEPASTSTKRELRKLAYTGVAG